MDMLRITDLKKSFGDKEVLRGLNLSVPEHSIFGFIGKNGAGKTTTMKTVLGLLRADSGEITVNGEKVIYGNTETNRYIGYLPDVPEYYSFMTAEEYLRFCGEISGGNADIDGAVVVAFDLCAKGGGFHIGHFRNNDEHRGLGRKFIHAHAHAGCGHLRGSFATANRQMIGLAVAGRGRQPDRLQNRIQFLLLHFPALLITAAGLACLRDFHKVHSITPL